MPWKLTDRGRRLCQVLPSLAALHRGGSLGSAGQMPPAALTRTWLVTRGPHTSFRNSERLLRVPLAPLKPERGAAASRQGVRCWLMPRPGAVTSISAALWLPSLLSMIADDRLLAMLAIPRSVIATWFRLPRAVAMVTDHGL